MMRHPLVCLAGLLLALLSLGATFYIDFGCTNNGDGTAIDCAASPGGAGPWNRIENAAFVTDTSTTPCADTYSIRGAHTTHGSNHDAPDTGGRYFGNEWAIRNACTVGNDLIIQAHGWTGVGTGERVFLDGTRCPSAGTYTTCGAGSGWTQCVWDGSACDCDAGNLNVQIGAGGQTACEQTWWTSSNGTAGTGFQSGAASGQDLGWAQKDDGSITYRVGSLAAMTNANGGYVSGRCSSETWKPCTADSECVGAGTCSASSPEVDSFINGSFVLLVRWGSLPTRPYIPYTSAGDAFALKSTASYITIRGVNMRAHEGPVVWNDAGSDHNTFQDVRVFFSHGPLGSGADYGITTYDTDNLTIKDSEIAYTVSEGIHAQCFESGAASVFTQQRNWVHHIGAPGVLGVIQGTAHGLILGDSGAAHQSNWTGSVMEDSVVGPVYRSNQTANVLRLENAASGWIIRNNYLFGSSNDPCVELDGSDGTSDGNEIYNNVIADCGSTGLDIFCGTPGTVRNNKVYNNTIVNAATDAINQSDNTGTCTGNEFRNNILYKNASQRMVNVAMAAEFDNNDVYSTIGGTIATLNGSSFTCANIGTLQTGNLCSDPLFASSTDFHIQTSSPARDAGTATGIPAGRTTDITNTLAAGRGLPDYNDADTIQGGTWDIGADEFFLGGVPKISGKVAASGKVTIQ